MVAQTGYTGKKTIVCLFHLLEYSTNWNGHTAVDFYADMPITGIALAGAIGFIQRWRLVNARVWRLWAWVYPLWNLVFWTDFVPNTDHRNFCMVRFTHNTPDIPSQMI